MAADPFDLERFVQAQQPIFAQVRRELAAGCKASHWMWFVFPQLRGLGRSSMARHYGISGLEEAQAYLRHELLGARLIECTQQLNALAGRTIEQILGHPDDLKFRSTMTLFAAVPDSSAVFAAALSKYFAAVPDPLTLDALANQRVRR